MTPPSESTIPKLQEPEYGNATEAELAQFRAALLSAAREDADGAYRWHAPCPRCAFEVIVEIEKIRGLEEARPRAVCLCSHNHGGRPAAVAAGCGFDVTVPWTGRTSDD